MDLTWTCPEVAEAADVVDWRAPGELGAAALGVAWFENAESRVTDDCVQPCSPSNDCYEGQCTASDGSTVDYRQDIYGEGANVQTVTTIQVYPVDGSPWDELSVRFDDTRTDDGTTATHEEEWIVSWEGLLVAEWPQDASFVARRSSGDHFSGTVESRSEGWLDAACSWNTLRTDGIDSTTWTVDVGLRSIGVFDAPSNCTTAASTEVDGVSAGWVDRDTWVWLADACPSGIEDPPAEDTGVAADAGCGCATRPRPGLLGWALPGLALLVGARRARGRAPS